MECQGRITKDICDKESCRLYHLALGNTEGLTRAIYEIDKILGPDSPMSEVVILKPLKCKLMAIRQQIRERLM